MFKSYNINDNTHTLSVRNMILLFLTIVMWFWAVLTLGQISIPSSISNARQTIGQVTITATGINTAPLIDMSSGGIFIEPSLLDEETNFSWKVLGINDEGNVIYVLSESLVISWTSAWDWESGYWTGNGSHIYNTNAGNVWIWTSTMSGKLHIQGSGETEVYIEETNSGNAANLNLKNTTRTWAIGWDSSPDVFYIWKAGGAIDFAITPVGYVGIGTSAPKGILQVVGNFIAGDYSNEANGTSIAVVWWHGNSSSWDHSFMWWWVINSISIKWIKSAIIWGIYNTIGLSGNNFIGWWQNNNIQGGFSAILMWLDNEINANNSVIWWWRLNVINSWADYSVIAGWRSNKILSMSQSFIWGGYDNEVGWSYSVIWGGFSNDIVGWSDNSNVVWGYDNNIRDWSDHSSIVWGYWNNIYTAQKASIWWWRSNTITSADYSTIAGGRNNEIISTTYASIWWGRLNTITGTADYSTIAGGFNNKIYTAQKTFIWWWQENLIDGASNYSFIPWWISNSITNAQNSISAGNRAKNTWYANTFVWNSNTGADFNADRKGSFLINVPASDDGSAQGGVGINTNNPTEALSVNWAISIWNTTTTTTGAIKFSWSNFFGYNWTNRVQLDN